MRTRIICVQLLLLFFGNILLSQSQLSISGYVKDVQSGEELLYANVLVAGKNIGTTTNLYGFYSLTLPEGDYEIVISYIGYDTKTIPVKLFESNLELNVELSEQSNQLEEVVVTGKAKNEAITQVQMSRIEVPVEEIKKLPAFFGEVDVIKTIQQLPGVTTAGEGTSGFFVRGGGADQNLILIDEAPVYDASHLFGLISVFNADIIKNAELYKGGIPSKYGGRLSSLLEVTTRNGNDKEYEVHGGIGLLASRLAVEGPIVKEKASFIASARRSYIDVAMPYFEETKDTKVFFHDYNFKINYRGNNKNRYFISFYSGKDKFKFGNFGFDWGNTTGTLRWNHLFSDKLFSNTTLTASEFSYAVYDSDAADGFRWEAGQQEASIKQDFTWYLSPKVSAYFGYQFTYRKFKPGLIKPNSDESIFKKDGT